MTATADVLIIGAGIIGGSVAFHLLERNPRLRVTILEAEPEVGTGSTSKATGGVRFQFSTEANIRLTLLSYRTGFYVHRQGKSAVLMGGTDKDIKPGLDTSVDWEAFGAVFRAAAKRVPPLAEAKVMEYYKISYKDWEAAGAKFFRGSYAEQAGAFKDRNVDGTFTFLALPGASVTEASVGRNLRLLAFPKPLLQHLASFGLGEGPIPAGTYPKAANGNEPVLSATMGTTITVNARMSNDTAYLLAKTLNDNVDRVRKIHGSLADYDPSKGHLYLGVTLHPGAEKYYREKGWLK